MTCCAGALVELPSLVSHRDNKDESARCHHRRHARSGGDTPGVELSLGEGNRITRNERPLVLRGVAVPQPRKGDDMEASAIDLRPGWTVI